MRPEGRDRLTSGRGEPASCNQAVQVNGLQSIVRGVVHPDAVAAVKARIKATMILLERRDMAVPPFVFERSVARYMDLCAPEYPSGLSLRRQAL